MIGQPASGPHQQQPDDATADMAAGSSGLQEMAGVIVTAIGLAALVAIVIVAFYQLPSGTTKSANIVALATSAFGVIGAIVGAFFGIRSANRAADRVSRANDKLATKVKTEL